jgi:hypothetical protein
MKEEDEEEEEEKKIAEIKDKQLKMIKTTQCVSPSPEKTRR